VDARGGAWGPSTVREDEHPDAPANERQLASPRATPQVVILAWWWAEALVALARRRRLICEPRSGHGLVAMPTYR
jgi:hypothetical protein